MVSLQINHFNNAFRTTPYCCTCHRVRTHPLSEPVSPGRKIFSIGQSLFNITEPSEVGGMKLGRPQGKAEKLKLDDKREEIQKYLDKGGSRAAIAKIVECPATTLFDEIGVSPCMNHCLPTHL